MKRNELDTIFAAKGACMYGQVKKQRRRPMVRTRQKTPIAYSTKAASDLIVVLSRDGATIKEVHDRITYDVEARKILEVYISKGYGNAVAKEFFN